jgi:squalene synthase HpnC
MFSDDLALYGPEAKIPKPLRPAQGRKYCRRLARGHYENFTVVSWLLPRRLRQHFYNVYAYCRWSDDLADEPGDPQKSLVLLDWWEKELRDCYAGKLRHPVFIALSETIRKFDIPIDPFIDLLVAFRQDQRVRCYDNLAQLTEYCRYSANPVGRLILYLGKCHSRERVQLSDSICTGLQLANFWQDVARDYAIGRVYLPTAEQGRFGYTPEMLARREVNDAFRRLLAAEVDLAEGYLRAGLPLVRWMPPELQLDIALFIHGGLAILRAIRQQNYDVWTSRPVVSRKTKLRLLLVCWWELKRGRVPEEARVFA